MLVTKNVADLCVLLVNELYGQLPSRIFAALISKGRSTVAHLAHHTSLQQRQVRHGIAVLIQQNLIFHHTDEDSTTTYYDANPSAAYNLVRTGKILHMVNTKYGDRAKRLVHDVLLSGHMEIQKLVEGYKEERGQQEDFVKEESVNGDSFLDHSHVNGNGEGSSATEEEEVDPTEAYDLLAELLVAGILEPVIPTMFQSPQDLRTTVEQEVLKDFPNGGVRGSKQTSEFDKRVKEKLWDIKDECMSLKRNLELEFMREPSTKRRKLTNGGMSNGLAATSGGSLLQDQSHTVIRLNYDKCMVELRNQKLSQHVEGLIGETTAQVYSALLGVLSRKISRCQVDLSTIAEGDEEDAFKGPSVTTDEVFEHLSPSIDVSVGIGTASEDNIDIRYAEKIRRYPPKPQGSLFQATLDEGDEIQGSDDEDYDHSGEGGIGIFVNGSHGGASDILPGENGLRDVKVKSNDRVSARSRRLHQLRQHLLILAESKQRFVRHCGGRGHGEWTIDFDLLVQQLKFVELDTMIEESFGRQGLRLTRILREKGKIDDKTLPTMALMRKPDVHVKMAEMEMAGFLDVQEVPRDNNRAANRTIFFWFFDEERTMQRTLDNTYKSMVRCLQRLEVERRKKKQTLSVAERRDVQGKEEERLRSNAYKEYLEFVDIESKLLAQVARLDDLVGIFRDF